MCDELAFLYNLKDKLAFIYFENSTNQTKEKKEVEEGQTRKKRMRTGKEHKYQNIVEIFSPMFNETKS